MCTPRIFSTWNCPKFRVELLKPCKQGQYLEFRFSSPASHAQLKILSLRLEGFAIQVTHRQACSTLPFASFLHQHCQGVPGLHRFYSGLQLRLIFFCLFGPPQKGCLHRVRENARIMHRRVEVLHDPGNVSQDIFLYDRGFGF